MFGRNAILILIFVGHSAKPSKLSLFLLLNVCVVTSTFLGRVKDIRMKKIYFNFYKKYFYLFLKYFLPCILLMMTEAAENNMDRHGI